VTVVSTTAEDRRESGVEFTYDEAGLVTAKDLETGIASCGESKAEALAMLAEALELHEGGGEPIEDEAAFLDEIGLDAEEFDEDVSPPPWLE
jgi:predicted RNase H-like HicB family nuclease